MSEREREQQNYRQYMAQLKANGNISTDKLTDCCFHEELEKPQVIFEEQGIIVINDAALRRVESSK